MLVLWGHNMIDFWVLCTLKRKPSKFSSFFKDFSLCWFWWGVPDLKNCMRFLLNNELKEKGEMAWEFWHGILFFFF